MQNLDPNTQFEIIMILPLSDLFNLCLCSKQYHKLCRDERLWTLKTKRDFNLHKPIAGLNWYRTYIQRNSMLMYREKDETPSSYRKRVIHKVYSYPLVVQMTIGTLLVCITIVRRGNWKKDKEELVGIMDPNFVWIHEIEEKDMHLYQITLQCKLDE